MSDRHPSSTKEDEPIEWKSTNSNPELEASLLNGLLFLWMQPLFQRAAYLHKHGRALQQDDLMPLPAMDHGDGIEQEFRKSWDAYPDPDAHPYGTKRTNSDNKPNLEARLRTALWAVTGRRLVVAGIIKFFNTCLQFSFPILLNQILKFFEDTQTGEIDTDSPGLERNKGYWLSALLMIAIASKAITESAYFHRVNRCGYQVKTAVSAAVYSKSLRLSSAAQHDTTLGEMVNLMQVDATKIEAFVPQIHVLWDGILQIAGYMTILGTLLGWPCVTGLVIMMLAGPVMGVIMGKLFATNRAMVKYTDDRVKTTNEALQGIRCVKMYTWEDSFGLSIGKSRAEELQCLKTVAYLRGFARAYMTALPTVAAVSTFVVYAYATDGDIAASTLFASIVAFDQLRFPLLFYPMALAQLAQAKVSVGRVGKFLNMLEVTDEGYTRDDNNDKDGGGGGPGEIAVENTIGETVVENTTGEIVVENTTVYWSNPTTPMAQTERDDDDDASMRSLKADSQHTKSSVETTGDFVYAKPVVSNVSLRIAPGELCAVVGRVGSGKSSLCAAVLNETILAEGSKVAVRGKIAYVAQSAWILNKTVRDNILFGLPYDETKYKAVIKTCQLTHDIALLDDGDLTEIGERGINLSGGQKQRISVARAAYSDADVVILDDPLSALDPEVAGQLFEECIVEFMKGKTRLLVTNQLQCLPKCDSVIALGKGRVIEQGTYSDLMNDQDGEIQRLLNDLKKAATKDHVAIDEAVKTGKPRVKDVATILRDDTTTTNEEEDVVKGGEPADGAADQGHQGHSKEVKLLTSKEEREVGAVKAHVYFKYIKAGGGYLKFAWVYFFFVLCAGVNLMATVWVSLWTSDTNYERQSQGFYLGMYASTAVLLGIFTFFRSYILATFGVRAAGNLHEKLLSSILKAPMTFFDTTPTGRILARFSKDMHSIDQELADFLDFFLFMSISVVVTLGAIVFATPWFGVALVPVLYVYFRVLNYFREVSRETKRLESLSRSPVYAHFSETLGGLSTIRAYGESANFLKDFEEKLDDSTQAVYCNKAADRWLSVRLELIGSVIAGLAAVFATNVVVSGGATGTGETDKFASLAGLSLTYAISITGMLNWVVRSFAQVEAAMNSCERVFYYSENIPQEAPPTTDVLEKRTADGQPPTGSIDPSSQAIVAAGGKVDQPSADWPSKGGITLHHLCMRYRPDTPLVLKGLNVTIGGGERIGVVGRTGSGKSSLLLCLMRIVEPELTQVDRDSYIAPISIDGVDVLRIGLYDLRSKLGIIPQNPVLFSGTIRSNVDPFDEYTDAQIWSALEQCGMKQAVLTMPDELLAPIAEYGENLSQGQRQLLCLGRALLKQCRILLLDEATSSVDFETDREIQRTLREAFTGCTVLTIAHRVNTIMDSDKILVMKDGVATEFAPPAELLQDETSLFSEIVRHSKAEHRINRSYS